MTAGYQPQAHGPDEPSRQPGTGDGEHRPGPLPPRIEPQYPATAQYPSASPGYQPEPTTVIPPVTWSPPPAAGGPWGAPPPQGGGAVPGQWSPTGESASDQWQQGAASAPPAAPAPGATYPPANPVPAQGYPSAAPQGHGYPSSAAGSGPAHPSSGPGQGYPPGVGPGAPAPARRGWLGIAALSLAGVLLLVTGFQAYQINRLDDRLAATDDRLAAAQSGDGTRLEGLETRADALEKQAGDVFNPEAIAAAVLPSVFRVKAGNFTGTAFAVGQPVAGGGAYLFTNYHVVESIWVAGDRDVSLERTGQRFPATIEKVDKENDIAQLKTTGKFNGLVTAPSPVKSGQQIVVVGAPLGLTDSVTTGVVSAFRKNENGPGEVIQFDAPINPGNSGGPVINGAKEVVGIATAKARDAEGIGLAVPIKTACDGFKIC